MFLQMLAHTSTTDSYSWTASNAVTKAKFEKCQSKKGHLIPIKLSMPPGLLCMSNETAVHNRGSASHTRVAAQNSGVQTEETSA